MLDVITRRGDLERTLQIGAEILGSEDPRNRGDHPANQARMDSKYLNRPTMIPWCDGESEW